MWLKFKKNDSKLLPGKDFKLFNEYKKDFSGIDGHALFIGTVLHSLDHYLNEKHADPLMFDIECPNYGKMNEVLRLVRSCYVEKSSGYLFPHTYKNAPHPFYKKVYQVAKEISPELADQMDACIIR